MGTGEGRKNGPFARGLGVFECGSFFDNWVTNKDLKISLFHFILVSGANKNENVTN
jgi:hypothetical protein